MALQFEWDPRKAANNLRKHKVSFEEAQTVFQDEFAMIFPDEDHSKSEDREIIIGRSAQSRILLVCFIERERDLVRLISARRATKYERDDFEKNSGAPVKE
jgi:uncharacterized DUF497 family protein